MRQINEDVGDPKKVKEAGKREKILRHRESEDLKWVLSTRRGRRFYWRVLSRCGIYKSSFEPSAKIYFNEGERNIGLFLINELMTYCPEVHVQMIKEEKEEENV